MRLGLALGVMAMLVGCGSGADGEEPSSTTAATVPSVVSSDDPRPVLTMGFWTYGPTEYWRPKDLADVYVYPDGTVIRVGLDGGDNSDTRVLRFEQLTIDGNQLQNLIRLADFAGLTGGALQPLVTLPEGVQVQDGGAAVFIARAGDVQTARAVDQLSTDNSFAVGDRIPFGHLLASLASLCCEPRDDVTVQPVSRWAVVSAPGDGYSPDAEQTWTGPNLADLAWVDIGNDVRCAVVERDHWPLTLNERRAPSMVFDGRVITRRPLLPHEHSCNDVAAVRALLNLDQN